MIVRESINFNQISDPFDSLRIGGKLIEIHLITVENPGNGIDEVYTLSETGTVKCLEMLQSGKKERNCTYKFTVTPQTDEEWRQSRVVLTLPQVAGNRIEFNDVIYKIPKSLKESVQSFERSENPNKSLGIGRITKIERWIEQVNNHEIYNDDHRSYGKNENEITNYHINDDLTIDVFTKTGYGDALIIRSPELEELPEFIQFRECRGNFYINVSHLKTMRGCPEIVTGHFLVNDNHLRTLEGFPKQVDAGIYIQGQKTGVKFTKEQIKSICKTKEGPGIEIRV